MKKREKTELIRVMLVDDHQGLRRALRKIIELQPDLKVVAEAGDGLTAIEMISRMTPDVILMDGSMPGLNGIETTRRLKQIQPAARIIGLTLYQQSTYLEEMVAAGASGYLLKTGATESVIDAIRVVNSGGTFLDPAVPRRISPKRHRPSSVQELSKNELAVARLLASGKTNREIADSLGLEVPAVEKYRASAMKKLDVNSRVELVRLAAERHWADD